MLEPDEPEVELVWSLLSLTRPVLFSFFAAPADFFEPALMVFLELDCLMPEEFVVDDEVEGEEDLFVFFLFDVDVDADADADAEDFEDTMLEALRLLPD